MEVIILTPFLFKKNQTGLKKELKKDQLWVSPHQNLKIGSEVRAMCSIFRSATDTDIALSS